MPFVTSPGARSGRTGEHLPRRARLSLLWAASLLLGACAGEAPHGDAGTFACEAPLETCELGLFFGRCPGDDAAVLACSEATGSCRWFTGSCPEGYAASACAPEDRCCEAGADGPWPFADDWRPRSSMAIALAVSELEAIGQERIDEAAPVDLEVTLDPSHARVERPTVVCGPGAELQICEGSASETHVLRVAPYATERSLVLRFFDRELVNDSLLVEVLHHSDPPRARTFLRRDEDAALSPAATCSESPRFAIEGRLTLSSFDPSDVTGRLEGTLPGGASIDLSF